MLLAATDRQEIVVEYTRSVPEGFYRGVTPASGAQVTVTGSEVHRFSEDPQRPGIYRASFLPRSGERYTLRVQGPAGEVVTGVTTVPGAPRLLAPERDTTVALGRELVLRWNRSPHAAAYTWIHFELNRPSFLAGIPKQDTATTVNTGTLTLSVSQEVKVQLQVAAVDSNYVRYEEGRAGDLPDARYQLRSTVQGGWGLFGSAALSNPRVVTIR
jgi:hypothetical protein